MVFLLFLKLSMCNMFTRNVTVIDIVSIVQGRNCLIHAKGRCKSRFNWTLKTFINAMTASEARQECERTKADHFCVVTTFVYKLRILETT